MNKTIVELNKFFNSCYWDLQIDKERVMQIFPITNNQIVNINSEQPDINIYELTKLIALNAGYRRATRKCVNGKTKKYSAYANQFDNALSCLWFSYERFLFMRTLGVHPEYAEFAVDVVIETFYRFFKHVDLDKLNDPKMVTTFLTQILHSNIVNEIVKRQHIKYKGDLSFEELNPSLEDTEFSFDEVEDDESDHWFEPMCEFFKTDTEFVDKIKRIANGGGETLSDEEKERLLNYINGVPQYMPFDIDILLTN